MGMGHEWKVEAVKVLEDLKHRPSAEVRQKAGELLKQAERLVRDGFVSPDEAVEDRRVAELRKAATRYDRNAGRR